MQSKGTNRPRQKRLQNQPSTNKARKNTTHHVRLLLGMRVDARSVLGAPVAPLAVNLRGVDAAEEHSAQLLERHLGRVVVYLSTIVANTAVTSDTYNTYASVSLVVIDGLRKTPGWATKNTTVLGQGNERKTIGSPRAPLARRVVETLKDALASDTTQEYLPRGRRSNHTLVEFFQRCLLFELMCY